ALRGSLLAGPRLLGAGRLPGGTALARRRGLLGRGLLRGGLPCRGLLRGRSAFRGGGPATRSALFGGASGGGFFRLPLLLPVRGHRLGFRLGLWFLRFGSLRGRLLLRRFLSSRLRAATGLGGGLFSGLVHAVRGVHHAEHLLKGVGLGIERKPQLAPRGIAGTERYCSSGSIVFHV